MAGSLSAERRRYWDDVAVVANLELQVLQEAGRQEPPVVATRQAYMYFGGIAGRVTCHE